MNAAASNPVPFSKVDLDAIAQLLCQKTGIDSNIINRRSLTKAIETYCVQGGCDIRTYLHLLRNSAPAMDELIEQIVVPETYFFRDRKPFECLQKFVQTRSIAQPLKILSIPCSTGEEPYSIAITLLEAGLSSHQFQIEAIDISHRAIAKAKRGIYGKNSFRGEPWIPLDRYFQVSEKDYALRPDIRKLVNFKQGNLLEQRTSQSIQYDVIFCRNLLIYLDSEVCAQAFETFWHLLRSDGLLFIGGSETGKVNEDLFKSLRQPFTFGYRRHSDGSTPAASLKSMQGAMTKPTVMQHPSLNQTTNPRIVPTVIQRSPPVNSLAIAQQLADQGKTEEAIAHCQNCLQQESTNADAYTLLGILYQAKSELSQAEQYFRKALYLNPNDYNALAHLALLKESLGDIDSAKTLQRRIQKLA
jgi:chemotaxis protein methyltransferase WspC